MHAQVPGLDKLFSSQEIAQFEKDDVKAGSHLCTMLTCFFLYTLIVMGYTVWWTLDKVS